MPSTKISKLSTPRKRTLNKLEAKKKVAQKPTTQKVTTPKSERAISLTVKIYDINGKITGSTILPKEFFGQKPNKKLLSQALRIYFTNATAHFGNTKTRSETRGGGRKPWRQKGTGNARAGSKRSPLWVGGAVSLGPKFRKTTLVLPKKMKKAALASALSSKAKEGGIAVVSNFESIKPKTKIVANLISKMSTTGETLLLTSQKNSNLKLASRNIPNVSVDDVRNINPYSILKSTTILFSKEALTKLS